MIKNQTKETAIFAGAFNPPTIWHKTVIRQILTSESVSKVIFSPDWVRLDKNYWTTREERLEMNRLFYEDLLKEWFNVWFDDYFLNESPDITCTIEAEKYFTKKLWFQPYHIFWTDVIKNMHNWRLNHDHYIEKKLKKIFLLRKGVWVPNEIENMENYILLDLEIPQISSTMVREMIKNKIKVDSLISPWVKSFIKENKLYTN